MRTAAFSGSRSWSDRQSVVDAIDSIRRPFRGIVGGAPGFDTLVEEELAKRGIPYLRFNAKWKRYRNGAGPKRNGLMLDWLRFLDTTGFLVVGWDGTSPGTADCIAQATVMLIPRWPIAYHPELNQGG